MALTLKSEDLADVNSFKSPKNISPKESAVKLKGGNMHINIPAYSVTVLIFKMK